MAAGDWKKFKHPATIVLAIGIALLAAKAVSDLSSPVMQSVKDVRNTKEYTNHPQVAVKQSSGVPNPHVQGAKEQEVSASQVEQRAEADLKAQQDMVYWAKWMTWATVASTIATIGGLLFVFRTLSVNMAAVKAATDANEIAREIGQSQVRAYLDIQGVSIEVDNVNDAFMVPHLYIRAHNSGSTPARHIKCFATLYPFFEMENPSFDWQPLSNNAFETVPGNSQHTLEGIVPSMRFPHFESLEDAVTGRRLMLALKITFEDVFHAPHDSVAMFSGGFSGLGGASELHRTDGNLADIFMKDDQDG